MFRISRISQHFLGLYAYQRVEYKHPSLCEQLNEPISILLVEDQEIVRLGLSTCLKQHSFDIVGEATEGDAAVRKTVELRPDLALMDILLPGLNGIEATRQIKAIAPQTRVLMCTNKDDHESLYEALNAGADGFCSKEISQDELAAYAMRVAQGQFFIEPRLVHKLLSEKVPSGRGRDIIELLTRKLTVDELGVLLDSGTAVRPARDSSPKLLVGTIFLGKYKVERFIGHGGMGMVYQATHLLMGRKVAIKLLQHQLCGDKKWLKRFHEESRALASLKHASIVTVYDYGLTGDGMPYLVMDFIEGRGLDALLSARGPIPLSEFFEIFVQVCDGLAEAHENGIVHCDLKPGNIVVEETAKGRRVKIVDFGLSKVQPVGKGNQFKSTDAFEILGSPLYMSPEQCRGLALDYRTDLYSLGLVMYEALCGEPAFAAPTAMMVFMKQVEEAPPRLETKLPDVELPEALLGVLDVLLQKDPGARYLSAANIAMVLRSLI